jgi:hypothetical protein
MERQPSSNLASRRIKVRRLDLSKFRVVFAVLLVLILSAVLAGSALAAEEHAFIGSAKCKKCHIKQYRSWEETAMAQSFENLRAGQRSEEKIAAGLDPDKDYTADPECVSCHTAGYGKEGGFVDEASTPGMLGVGCEMCHGPGGTYVADEYMSLKNKEYKRADIEAVGSVYPPREEECMQCHNDESPFVGEGYVFDFEQRKAEGAHETAALKYEH